MMNEWGGDKGDPIKDMQRLRDVEPEYGPVNILVTKNEAITLKAMDIYTKWKEQWRKKHPILYFMERVMDKIRGGRSDG